LDRTHIAIIIPALNEAASIAAVLARVGDYGLPIVVDDGSTDATAAIAKAGGAEVVSHAVNQGYDGALSSGFERAAALGCQYVITMDADGQHNPAQLAQIIQALDDGNDLVLGVRDRQQRIGETIFCWIGKLFWRISDPLCGMKGYRISQYQRWGFFDSFKSIGTELAVRSVVNHCKFIELPILTRDRMDAPRFGRVFAANCKIIRAMLILIYLHSFQQLRKQG
jgi:glycosyltransferase involved in cell wall biosynthesis